ncbi:MAG: hypothetical protein R2741_00250 [Methanolobus sp.]
MEALAWQGENPVIKPENMAYDPTESDGFSVNPDSRELEAGDTVKVSVTLPSDIFKAISSLFSENPRTLTLKSNSGTIYQTITYDDTHSFWTKSEFEETLTIPEDAEYGYTYLVLDYGDETKAVNWFYVGSSPLKEITAENFNKYLQTSYQENQHTFSNYAINIKPDVEPSQVKIDKINGTLVREISRSPDDETDYPVYYTMTVENLSYTLVDFSTNSSGNRTMNVTAVITSREPLLEELVNEYERELNGGTASDIVLGTTNIRTFVYGPWQHYLNGPLNIVTNPALSSSVNTGTLYTQKRVFNSVDPWALTYTTYYNGKVFYSDIKGFTDDYENEKESNVSTTYDNLAEKESFNLSISQGINQSMQEVNTTMEEVENNSKIIISVSNFTDEVYSNWIYNDEHWSDEQPDLIHEVTHEVYSANIQGQVFRDGFNNVTPYNLHVGPTTFEPATWQGGSSKSGKDIMWTAHYPINISHTCALSPDYNFDGTLDVDHKVNIDASSHKWYYKSVNVDHVSTDIECEGVDVVYEYIGNDTTLNLERTDGYLSAENHSFDWKVTYNIKFRIRTRWDIDYTYHWSYKTYSSVSGLTVHSGDSYGTRNNYPLTDYEKVSHTQTETENFSIVYYQLLPSGGYSDLENYVSGSANDYQTTTVVVDGIPLTDKDCSDAADKYREHEVMPKLHIIQGNYFTYTNGTMLPEEKVYCDIPDWLHYKMTHEMEEMFNAINTDNPTREVYLLGENLGKNPTALIQEASLDIADEMGDETKRESFTQQEQYMETGNFSTSSDACRAIAKNEAYERLLIELKERYSNAESSFDDQVENSFSDEQGHSLLDLVMNSDSTSVLFNNPAMDSASTALAAEMGIVEPMQVECLPGEKYNWTENITVVVDQCPDYLYHDPEFDLQNQYKWETELGKEVYPLAVRNVCVFSTGIGDDISDMLSGATAPMKDAVAKSMSQSISDANAEVDSLIEDIATNNAELTMSGVSTDTSLIEENRTRMMDAYSTSLRDQLPSAIASEVAKDPVLNTWISDENVEQITNAYIATLSDDELADMTADNTLQEEIFAQLSGKIMADNPAIPSDDLDVALYRLEADMQIGVTEGVCLAVLGCQAVVDECFANINSELQDKLDESADKLTGQFAEKIEKRLQKSMKMVPVDCQ